MECPSSGLKQAPHLLHSFRGSSLQSLQSCSWSHTLLMSMHSPLLHLNFPGPKHWLTIRPNTGEKFHGWADQGTNGSTWTPCREPHRFCSWLHQSHPHSPGCHCTACCHGYSYHLHIQIGQVCRFEKLWKEVRQWNEASQMIPQSGHGRELGSYLRQLTSSLPSLQSGSPSHRHFLWMHSPEPHWISLAGHFVCIAGCRPHCSRDSSDWSEQSASSSHTQLRGMQEEVLHWNSCAPQVGGAQSSSSLPSSQSSWPLHTKFLETQRPLEQVNSSALQVMLPVRGKMSHWKCISIFF